MALTEVAGRPSVSDETVDAVREEAFERSPGKSTRRAWKELRVPQSTVLNISHKYYCVVKKLELH